MLPASGVRRSATQHRVAPALRLLHATRGTEAAAGASTRTRCLCISIPPCTRLLLDTTLVNGSGRPLTAVAAARGRTTRTTVSAIPTSAVVRVLATARLISLSAQHTTTHSHPTRQPPVLFLIPPHNLLQLLPTNCRSSSACPAAAYYSFRMWSLFLRLGRRIIVSNIQLFLHRLYLDSQLLDFYEVRLLTISSRPVTAGLPYSHIYSTSAG